MGIPAWEIPFAAIGKVLLALPEAITNIASVAGTVENDLKPVAQKVSTLLSDAAMAITDKGLNITLDATVAKDFLTAFSQLKQLVEDVEK